MKKKHVVIASVITLLLVGVVWALYNRPDPAVAEAKQMRDEMLKNMDSMTGQERRAQFETLRDRMRDFTPEQRREFGSGMRQFMMQRVDRILALPPDQQRAELDRIIDQMEEFRQNREPRGERPDRGGNMSAAQRDQRRKQGLDRTTPEMRGKMDAMRDLLNDRRNERGLEPMRGGGRGMFGGGMR